MIEVADRPRIGTLLRDWRRRRRMSQLDLALEAGVSARHVSFELAIESFFPADAATARALEARSRVRS